MRKSFSLIEVLVSVTLLSIIVLFLVNSSFNLQKGYESLYKKESKTFSDYEVKEVLYKDLLEANEIFINSGRKFDFINLKTKNSLFEREGSYVTYTVLQKENRLIRLESENNITLPIENDKIYKTDFLLIKENLEEFKVYESTNEKKKDLLMIYYKEKSLTPTFFEIGLINTLDIRKK
ncbi:MAG: prepilin-type N-terminal cleavage/methylation domain-containing protein [Campylobacterales bacterium]|nr:prepilin-type N-terminal cleavage/methylation domain-containing protein [Campylobacterales bacterium]